MPHSSHYIPIPRSYRHTNKLNVLRDPIRVRTRPFQPLRTSFVCPFPSIRPTTLIRTNPRPSTTAHVPPYLPTSNMYFWGIFPGHTWVFVSVWGLLIPPDPHFCVRSYHHTYPHPSTPINTHSNPSLCLHAIPTCCFMFLSILLCFTKVVGSVLARSFRVFVCLFWGFPH